jgi:transcriptional regulator with XRE-family HTH domain
MREEFLRRFGSRVRDKRQQRGLSQAALSRRIGVTQASLSNYETGRREMSLEHALSLASALNTSLGDLLPETDVITISDQRMTSTVRSLIRNFREFDAIEIDAARARN